MTSRLCRRPEAGGRNPSPQSELRFSGVCDGQEIENLQSSSTSGATGEARARSEDANNGGNARPFPKPPKERSTVV